VEHVACMGETNSMERSLSSEANSHSASREIPHLLWKWMVHYRVDKNPPLVPILSQMNPVHTLPPYFPTIHPNVTSIFPSTSRSSEWSLLLFSMTMCRTNFIRLHFVTLQTVKFHTVQFSLLMLSSNQR
jgi:hypothetical protein